jgi:LCP family protein required for cell wall assembly
MTAPYASDAGQDPPGRRPPRSRPTRRRRRLLLLLLALLVVAPAADAVLLTSRIHEVDIHLPERSEDVDGDTWVLVGLDSRAQLPAGASPDDFGTAEDVPGSRADVVVVVHRTDSGATALSVPRDLLVRSSGTSGRLALTWLDGPQATVDALCGLGIPTDHLITVGLGGFAATVDAAGGLEVDVPQPVRDRPAGLELTSTGRLHVDGATALALVRSRHPEHLVDGRWVPATVDPDGRATTAGAVLSALLDRVRESALRRPWRLQSVAWVASGELAVDPGTSAPDLAGLARADIGTVETLPASEPLSPSLVRLPTADTAAAVAVAGLSCSD